MEVTTTQYKHCDVVKATGRIDSATAPQLAEVMDAISDAGRHKIVFDMSAVEYISSAGLRVVINTQKKCKHLGRGELVLAAVPERIYNAFELAGFIPLFKFYEDVTSAVGNI
jgi:anti-sigma B factor antagonist